MQEDNPRKRWRHAFEFESDTMQEEGVETEKQRRKRRKTEHQERRKRRKTENHQERMYAEAMQEGGWRKPCRKVENMGWGDRKIVEGKRYLRAIPPKKDTIDKCKWYSGAYYNYNGGPTSYKAFLDATGNVSCDKVKHWEQSWGWNALLHNLHMHARPPYPLDTDECQQGAKKAVMAMDACKANLPTKDTKDLHNHYNPGTVMKPGHAPHRLANTTGWPTSRLPNTTGLATASTTIRASTTNTNHNRTGLGIPTTAMSTKPRWSTAQHSTAQTLPRTIHSLT